MNQERLMQVLLSPVVSEKSSMAADKGRQHVFKVLRDSNKTEIKKAVESLFNVKVEAVRLLNVKGKAKRFGSRLGQRQSWKKAYVQLAAGSDIDFQGSDLKV